jgi:hypothetical protein
MAIDFAILDTLAANGASAEQIIAVVRTMDAPAARKRQADADRLRRKRRHPDFFEASKDDVPPLEDVVSCITVEPEVVVTVGRVARHDATERDISKERKVSTPSKERNTTPRDVRAREGDSTKSCAITLEAFDLADAIGTEAGYTAATWPPGWCGAAGDIQRFLNEGYTPELIRMACTGVMRRGRGPPEYFGYFVKPIIDMRSRFDAPLPQVNRHQLEIIDGGRQRTKAAPMGHTPGPLQGAVQKLREELRRQTEPAESRAEPSGDVVRLLQAYRCQ